MDAGELDLTQLFQKSVQFNVPDDFQRPYVWNEEEQWAPLWQDICRLAEAAMADADRSPHFLGAVVLQQRPNPLWKAELRDVIDGQQRLITLQVVLAAARDVILRQCPEHGGKAISDRLSALLINDKRYQANEPDRAYKIVPLGSDALAFKGVIHSDTDTTDDLKHPIRLALKFYTDEITAWLTDDPEVAAQRAQALEDTLDGQLRMISIDLGPDDDPYVIFETLNARGTRLLQWDLVKNKIARTAREREANSSATIAGEIAKIEAESAWWRSQTGRGATARPRIDTYLYHYLIMRYGREISIKREAREYETAALTPASGSLLERTKDLVKIGSLYRRIENADERRIPGTFLYRWNILNVGVLTPTLLWLRSNDVPDERRVRAERALESYLVRRMACRLTTRGYYELFSGKNNPIPLLNETGPDAADEAIVRHLTQHDDDRYAWPTDAQFMEAVTDAPLYSALSRARVRLLLEAIEGRYRSSAPKAEENTVPSGLTIEHVLPQEWRKHWPLDTAPQMEDEIPEVRRNRLLHTVGNLTLVTRPLNTAMSNASWEKKRQALNDHTTLFLNKHLVEQDTWDEDAILARGHRLAAIMVEVWPGPDQI